MSRRDDNSDGSLDLLLDTICNAFGGVVFISLLVVVLLNMSSKEVIVLPPSETSQVTLEVSESQLSQASREWKRLQTVLQEQKKTKRLIVDPDLEEKMRKLEQSQRKSAELTAQKIRSVDQIRLSQLEVNKSVQKVKDLSESLMSAQQELKTIEKLLQQEIASRTRAAKLPKARQTTKVEVTLFLRNGRLCFYTRRGRDGMLEPNPTEYVETTDKNKTTYLEPKPGAGIPMNPQGTNTLEIDSRLSSFDSSQHYLAIFVWQDSFEHFGTLKERVVSKQFEYRLVPVPENEKIRFGVANENILVQ